jgi:hypothetical protein
MKTSNLVIASLTAIAVAATGCGDSPPMGDKTQPSATSSAADAPAEKGTAHSHGGWWCDEHGVPEEICALCNSKLAAEFQKKGDWCKDHDRPDSQCFICHPEFEEKFAAQYEAKYGKKPPRPEGS